MKRLFALFALFVSLTAISYARELPDFTELAAKYGTAVVNVSTTQTMRNANVFHQMPNLSEDDPMFDFFRRFMQPGRAAWARANCSRVPWVPASSSARMATS